MTRSNTEKVLVQETGSKTRLPVNAFLPLFFHQSLPDYSWIQGNGMDLIFIPPFPSASSIF